jgi:hypothetical protein
MTPPTLADLAAAPGELIASCQNCHHNATLPVDPVLARYGPTTGATHEIIKVLK